jgi:hypothetical protein
VQIDCAKSNSEPPSLQYVRLFGAVEVPLVLGLFGRPELKASSSWGKQFLDFLAPDGIEASVHVRTIKAFESYSFKAAVPSRSWLEMKVA